MKITMNMSKSININRLMLLLGALLSLSCGDLTGEETGAHKRESLDIVKVGGVDALGRGEGRFLLEGTADTGGNSRHRFRLRFLLPEGESVKFFFFSSHELAGGVEISWKRREGRVEMEIALNGYSHRHRLPALDAKDEIDLDVDVHNDHSDVHLLVWEKFGSHSAHEGCTFDKGCLYNTEDFALDVWLGVGRAAGTFWGVEGDKDSIITVEGPLVTNSNV